MKRDTCSRVALLASLGLLLGVAQALENNNPDAERQADEIGTSTGVTPGPRLNQRRPLDLELYSCIHRHLPKPPPRPRQLNPGGQDASFATPSTGAPEKVIDFFHATRCLEKWGYLLPPRVPIPARPGAGPWAKTGRPGAKVGTKTDPRGLPQLTYRDEYLLRYVCREVPNYARCRRLLSQAKENQGLMVSPAAQIWTWPYGLTSRRDGSRN